jgi:hypothetical protein
MRKEETHLVRLQPEKFTPLVNCVKSRGKSCSA